SGIAKVNLQVCGNKLHGDADPLVERFPADPVDRDVVASDPLVAIRWRLGVAVLGVRTVVDPAAQTTQLVPWLDRMPGGDASARRAHARPHGRPEILVRETACNHRPQSPRKTGGVGVGFRIVWFLIPYGAPTRRQVLHPNGTPQGGSHGRSLR